jgi:hypothetical protein
MATEVVGSHVYVGFEHVLVVKNVTNVFNPLEVAHRVFDGPVAGIGNDGNYLYVAASEGGLSILDISNPGSPLEVGSIDTPGSAVSVAVAGGYAFVADLSGGLRIIDVSTPSLPVEVAAHTADGNVTDVAVLGNYAYLSGTTDLLILDVSVPASPVVTGSNDIGGSSLSVAVQGNHAYILISINLRSYDVTDKANPLLIGSGLADQGREIALSGTHAFLASQAGLRIFDISDPTQLTFVGTAGGRQGLDVSLSGPLAYVAYSLGGFDIRDVSDVTNTQIVFDGHDAWDEADDMAIAGDYAYVASDMDLLKVVDVSDPDNFVEIGNMEFNDFITPSLDVTAITTTGNIVYVSQVPFGFGPVPLEIVDISDPMNPVHITKYEDMQNNQRINVMKVAGNYLYTAKGSFGLRIYDITTPTAPVPLSNSFTSGVAADLEVDGNITYLLDGAVSLGLRVLDTSALPTVTEIGNYWTPGVAKHLTLDTANNRLYIADEGNGLIILDVSVPATPVKIGDLTTIADANDVAISGDFAYVSDPATGVHVVDISNPAAPVEIGVFEKTSGGALRVSTKGDDVLLLDQFAGLFSLDNSALVTGIDDHVPESLATLFQNTPNPFNPQTRIRYVVSTPGLVQLQVYDISGRLVRSLVNEVQAPQSAPYSATWNGRDDNGVTVSSGVYFYRLVSPGSIQTKKMVLLK